MRDPEKAKSHTKLLLLQATTPLQLLDSTSSSSPASSSSSSSTADTESTDYRNQLTDSECCLYRDFIMATSEPSPPLGQVGPDDQNGHHRIGEDLSVENSEDDEPLTTEKTDAISQNGESLLPRWERFSQWIYCICVVTFDIELGQSIEVSAAFVLRRRVSYSYLHFRGIERTANTSFSREAHGKRGKLLREAFAAVVQATKCQHCLIRRNIYFIRKAIFATWPFRIQIPDAWATLSSISELAFVLAISHL